MVWSRAKVFEVLPAQMEIEKKMQLPSEARRLLESDHRGLLIYQYKPKLCPDWELHNCIKAFRTILL